MEIAIDHAEARVLEIRATADRILTAPHRGERHDNILPGLRHLTIDRAIYWFDVNVDKETVRILAVFSVDRITSVTCWFGSSIADEARSRQADGPKTMASSANDRLCIKPTCSLR